MNKKGKKKRKETNKEIAREWKGMQERTKVGRPKPEDEGQRSRSLRAEPTPRAEVVNTFDLLSGCGGPSSLPSALRGRGSLDSPGVIISARPIGADRKQEKQLSMTVWLCRKKHASRCKIAAPGEAEVIPPLSRYSSIRKPGNLFSSRNKKRMNEGRIQGPCNNNNSFTESKSSFVLLVVFNCLHNSLF